MQVEKGSYIHTTNTSTLNLRHTQDDSTAFVEYCMQVEKGSYTHTTNTSTFEPAPPCPSGHKAQL